MTKHGTICCAAFLLGIGFTAEGSPSKAPAPGTNVPPVVQLPTSISAAPVPAPRQGLREEMFGPATAPAPAAAPVPPAVRVSLPAATNAAPSIPGKPAEKPGAPDRPVAGGPGAAAQSPMGPAIVPPPKAPASEAESDPAKMRALLEEALQEAADKNDSAAIPKLEEIIRINPSASVAWEALGWAYWRQGRQNDSIELWNRLRVIDPGNPVAYNLLGRAAAAQNDLPRAIAMSRRSLELNPGQFNVRFDLARALLWNGDIGEAVQILDAALKEDPARSDVMLELARALTNSWHYEEALPYWKKLRELAPDNIDYLAHEALCRLHTNDEEAARDMAGKVLELQSDHPIALEIMANLEEFGPHPENAAPWLRKLVATKTDPAEKESVRVRLIRLLVRLHKNQPRVYSLDEPIQLTRDRLEYEPRSADAWLLLGELMLLDEKYDEAEEKFVKVLQDLNANSIRARKGLFEIYAAVRKYDLAREQLVALSAFNPHDPYLYIYLARLESERGDYHAAFQALDRLEEAGRRGAVAVVLYHGLLPSMHFPDVLAVNRFRDHLAVLQQAGFQFIRSGEIPAYLNSLSSPAPAATNRPPVITPVLTKSRKSKAAEEKPPMVVSINFDDGRKDTLFYGTQVAKEFGLVFSHHIPCGYVMQNQPFICSWAQLEEYAKTGCWEIGSHFVNAAILAPADPSGQLGHALANRIWIEDQKRMETPKEYAARLKFEFAESRRLLQAHTGQPVNFISYPFGDIGQEIETNTEGPTPRLIADTGRSHYDLGFLQSAYGYCIAGDDPMFYQRHEMDRWMDGTNVVEYLYEHHPVFLARRTRAEYAALNGKQYLAMSNVDWLERNGYPERPLKALKTYVRDRLAGKLASPSEAGTITKSFWDVDNLKPRVRAEGEYFKDNQDRTSWRAFGGGGVNLGPNLAIDGKAGYGQMKQDLGVLVTNNVRVGRRTVPQVSIGQEHYSVNERDAGVRGVYAFPNGAYISGETLARAFGGDADVTVMAGALESQVRPFLPLDLLLRYERDLAPSALAAVKEITYSQYMAAGVFRLRDWWDLNATGSRYNFSDDNVRDHLQAGTSWLLHERTGLRLGLSYDSVSADQESRAYWSPYHLRRYYVSGGFQGNYLRTYYNLKVRFGLGREDVRPEAEQRYLDEVARARVQKYDPGPPPTEDWEPVFGASASTRVRLGDHWVLNGEISYNKNPNYNELSILGGITYNF